MGNLHLFERELERQHPDFLTEDDYNKFYAHIAFLEAYYHFKLLNWFGPCPVMDHHYETDITPDQYPGRSHYDYVVDFICQRLDDAYPNLQEGFAQDDTYGLGNKAAALALKSRVLLYAASPLWNGEFPWPNWQNTNYETPGYGKELVSYTFSLDKWKRAKDATEAAIKEATNAVNGRKHCQVDEYFCVSAHVRPPSLCCPERTRYPRSHCSSFGFAPSTSLPRRDRPRATCAPFAARRISCSVFDSPLPSFVQNGWMVLPCQA